MISKPIDCGDRLAQYANCRGIRADRAADLENVVTLDDLPAWLLCKAEIPQPASGGEARA